MAFVYTSNFISAWDSWAVSVEGLTGLGYYEFSFDAPSGAICGIAEEGADEGYANILHGFYYEQSQYQVVERGVPKTSKVDCSSSTRFRVERHETGVRYVVDGTVVHSSTYLFPKSQITHLYAAMYSFGEKIVNALLVNLTGDASIVRALPGLIGFGSSDVISAIAGLTLPAYLGESVSEDGVYLQSILPGISGWSSADAISLVSAELPALDARMSLDETEIWIWTQTPGILCAASTDAVVLVDAALPAILGSAYQSDIRPNPIAVNGVLAAYNCFAMADDPAYVDAQTTALSGMAIAISEGESADVAILPGSLPAITGYAGLGASNYILVKVPAPHIVWLGMKDYLVAEAFSFQGWMSGGQTGGLIDAQVFSLDGQMFGGGKIEGELPLFLDGEMSGSVVVSGKIEGAFSSLEGEMTGAGYIDGVLGMFSGEISGFSEFVADISGQIFELSGEAQGSSDYSGSISAVAFTLTGEVRGLVLVSGTLSGGLPSISGSMDGQAPVAGSLDGELWVIDGQLHADAVAVGSISQAAFTLLGTLSSNALEITGQCVTMKYSRF